MPSEVMRLRQLVAEQRVGELRLAIDPAGGKIAGEVLEVVPVHPRRALVGERGHREHPHRAGQALGGGGLEHGQQQPGQQERGEVVGGEGLLGALGGHVALVAHAAGIVDQHVDAAGQSLDLAGDALDFGHQRHVAAEEIDLGVGRGGGADFGLGRIAARGVAAGADDVPAHRREGLGGFLADARARPGHHDGAVFPCGHVILPFIRSKRAPMLPGQQKQSGAATVVPAADQQERVESRRRLRASVALSSTIRVEAAGPIEIISIEKTKQ